MYRVEVHGKKAKERKIGFGDIKTVKFMGKTADNGRQNILLLRENGDLLSLRQVAWKTNLGLFNPGSIYKTYFDILVFMTYFMINIVGFCCIKYPVDWHVNVQM